MYRVLELEEVAPKFSRKVSMTALPITPFAARFRNGRRWDDCNVVGIEVPEDGGEPRFLVTVLEPGGYVTPLAVPVVRKRTPGAPE